MCVVLIGHVYNKQVLHGLLINDQTCVRETANVIFIADRSETQQAPSVRQ